MTRTMRTVLRVPFLLSIAIATVAEPQTARISGTVREEDSGKSVAEARIRILATAMAAATDARGSYVLRNVPAGTWELRVSMIGYASRTQTVTVTEGQRVTLDWVLQPVPFTLDEIVATATGDQSTRQLGNAVSTIDVASLAPTAPVTNLSQVLAGRVAGVAVLPTTGAAGAGSRIRIRGLSSASLANDPMVYVDGIRVNERGLPLTVNIGGDTPSFFDDYNPEEIESIEVIKGPSAATLYGTQAANGVIRITTKQGLSGPARLRAYAELGMVQDVANYRPTYFSKATGGDGMCLPFQQGQGLCTIEQLYRRDISQEADYQLFKTGFRQQYGLQFSGGTEATRYFLSAEFENTDGVETMPPHARRFAQDSLQIEPRPEQLDPAGLQRVNLRANLGFGLGSRGDVQVSVGYVNTYNSFTMGGGFPQSLVGYYTDASADPRHTDNPWPWGGAAYAFLESKSRSSDHFINGLNARYAPLSWLNLRATAGLDWVAFKDEALVRNGEAAPNWGYPLGFRTTNRFTTAKYTLDLGATAEFRLATGITSRSSIGAQYNRDLTTGTYATGQGLAPGSSSLSGAATRETSERSIEIRTLGTYLEQQFGFDDRLFVTGALRVDQNSSFGSDNRVAAYPKASASWTALEGTQDGASVSQIRLRAAYGQSGQQPGDLAALTYFSPIVVTGRDGSPRTGASLGGSGDPTLKPERSGEIEAGVDFAGWHNRLTAKITAYRKRTRDAIVLRPLPPSAGTTEVRAENIGQVLNEGLEVSLLSRPIESPGFSWDLGVEAAFNRNRLEDLGGTPPLVTFQTMSVVGKPLFSAYDYKLLSYHDANGDGVIGPEEIVMSDSTEILGSSIPTRTVSLNSTFNLVGGRLRILTQFDYKGGFYSTDATYAGQCSNGSCRDIADPGTPQSEQARAVSSFGHFFFTGWVQKADFVRWRELAVTYDLPAKWAKAVGGGTATVTLSARNLALWTGYTGIDPESAPFTSGIYSTSQDAIGSSSWYTLGQPRAIVLRINLGMQTGGN